MNRTLAVCLLLLGAACADNSSMILVGGRAAPDDPSTCRFQAGGEFLLGGGVLDVAASMQPTYELVVYVTNNLEDPAVTNPGSLTSAKTWHAYAAKVRVDPKSYVDAFGPNPVLLPTQLQNVTPLDGQAIPPKGSATIAVEAVSGPLGAQLATLIDGTQVKQIVLGITLQGKTGDEQYLDSGEWFFPVKLCSGCLAAPVCTPPQVLKSTNCFGTGQDSAPVCAAPT